MIFQIHMAGVDKVLRLHFLLLGFQQLRLIAKLGWRYEKSRILQPIGDMKNIKYLFSTVYTDEATRENLLSF